MDVGDQDIVYLGGGNTKRAGSGLGANTSVPACDNARDHAQNIEYFKKSDRTTVGP